MATLEGALSGVLHDNEIVERDGWVIDLEVSFDGPDDITEFRQRHDWVILIDRIPKLGDLLVNLRGFTMSSASDVHQMIPSHVTNSLIR